MGKKNWNKGKNGDDSFNRNRYSNPNANKPHVEGGKYVYQGQVTVEKLSEDLGLKAIDILKDLFMKKKIYNINSVLSDEDIGEICVDNGLDFEKKAVVSPADFEKVVEKDDPKDLVERPPVVTIMGHVDHGKTTLIDTIRDSHIADGEAGLITQEIGAYQKVVKGKKITFLDTPGHEAFSAMRQRGAQATDIVVLVVAADDGVMPQTVEAIDHAKAANVPIIVAINKIDKAGANPEKVKTALTKYGLVAEEWGGQTIMKNISAKKKIGIDDLLENILLVAEMKELKANPKREAEGVVIEATMDKKVGPKATLLVKNGTLHVGDFLVVGHCYCKVRRMTNEFNKSMPAAGPSTPVSITGLAEVPQAGDQFHCFENEKEAKQIAEERAQKDAVASSSNANDGITIANVYDRIAAGEMTVINLIVKADTEGTMQAISDSIAKLSVEGVTTKIIHAASGDITEGDVILASASSAIILAFNVTANALVTEKAKENKVEVRYYSIIYQLLEELEQAMKGKLKPVMKEVVYGHAEVGQVFKASKVGMIAGCNVKDGIIRRSANIRVLRKNVKLIDGAITSLKIGKDDMGEVKAGFDCGMVISNYKDVQIGDVIEAWGMEEDKTANGR
ncbi:MAG: translation initiation factor IF-2 [Bacilli bacterium]|jgi:translation initiation factor IF-2|nr:translation initiation factor IF-2 [Bacilli bacterium]